MKRQRCVAAGRGKTRPLAKLTFGRRPRSYARGEFIFDPLHNLALLEQKPRALDQAAPLQGWELPGQLAHPRRLIEHRPPHLDLSAYAHLPQANVRTTLASDYTILTRELAA